MFAGTEFLKSVIMSLLKQKMQFAIRHVMLSNVDVAYLISAGSYSKLNKLVIQIYHNTYYLWICASKILSKLLLKDPWAKNHIFAQSMWSCWIWMRPILIFCLNLLASHVCQQLEKAPKGPKRQKFFYSFHSRLQWI